MTSKNLGEVVRPAAVRAPLAGLADRFDVAEDGAVRFAWASLAVDPDGPSKVRRALSAEGFVVLEAYADAAQQALYRTQFLDVVDTAIQNPGARKYSLKYEAIADHAVVQRAKSAETLAFINGVANPDRAPLVVPFAESNIEVGYSITKGGDDEVSFHFDDRNFLNLIVPIILPEGSDSPLWATPNALPVKVSRTDRYVGSLLTRLANSPFGGLMPLRRFCYREGDAVLFHGYRTLHGVKRSGVDSVRAIASVAVRWPGQS